MTKKRNGNLSALSGKESILMKWCGKFLFKINFLDKNDQKHLNKYCIK